MSPPLPAVHSTEAGYSLACHQPYDWPHLERFLADHASPGVESVTPGRYARSFRIAGESGTLSVRHRDGALAVCIRGPVSRRWHGTILARLGAMFDLGTEPQAITSGLSRDPLLAECVRRRPGLRMPGAFDGFELAVRAILGQQVSVAAATRLAGRLVGAFGSPLTPEERNDAQAGLTHHFPAPEQLLDAEISLVLNMPRARGRAIQALAAATLAQPDLFAPGRDLERSVAGLMALPGIGEWTAHYIAMRALAQADALPAGDVGLMRALDDGDGRPTRLEILARAEAWRPWRAYAAIHLWAEDAARRAT